MKRFLPYILFGMIALLIIGNMYVFLKSRSYDITPTPNPEEIYSALLQKSQKERVSITVTLNFPNYVSEVKLNDNEKQKQRQAITQLENQVILDLPLNSYILEAKSDFFPSITLGVDANALTILHNSSNVKQINEEKPLQPGRF